MLYNINPDIWGKHFWKTMHYLSMAYPEAPTEQDKEDIKNFFTSISRVLPCAKCREHFKTNLKNYPLNDKTLSSRKNMINWVKDLHNEVNRRNDKKEWTYDEIIKEYGNDTESYTIEIITAILFALIMIIIIFYISYRRNFFDDTFQ